jgi:hypothetical protein
MEMKDFSQLLESRLAKVKLEFNQESGDILSYFLKKEHVIAQFRHVETFLWQCINKLKPEIYFKKVNSYIKFLIRAEFFAKATVTRDKKDGINRCTCLSCLRASFKAFVNNRIEQTRNVLDKKSAEYSDGQNDKLYNFKRAAEISGDSIEKALAGMMLKHEVSIWDILEEKRPFNSDMIAEKFGDMINYLILLEAVFTERESEKILGTSIPDNEPTMTQNKREFPALKFADALHEICDKLSPLALKDRNYFFSFNPISPAALFTVCQYEHKPDYTAELKSENVQKFTYLERKEFIGSEKDCYSCPLYLNPKAPCYGCCALCANNALSYYYNCRDCKNFSNFKKCADVK